jgi:hypothetical protein
MANGGTLDDVPQSPAQSQRGPETRTSALRAAPVREQSVDLIRAALFDMEGVVFERRNFWLDLHRAFGTEEEGVRLAKKHLDSDCNELQKSRRNRSVQGPESPKRNQASDTTAE